MYLHLYIYADRYIYIYIHILTLMPLDQNKPKKILCDLQLLLQKTHPRGLRVGRGLCEHHGNEFRTARPWWLGSTSGRWHAQSDAWMMERWGMLLFFCLWTYGWWWWWWWWWWLITYIDMNNGWGPKCTGVGRAQIEKHWSDWFLAHLPFTVTFEKGMLPFWLEVRRIDHHHNLIQEISIMDIK